MGRAMALLSYLRRSTRRRSIASQIIAPQSVPLNLSIATIPVGEVTLISVSNLPPMTSIPTKRRPRFFNSGLKADRKRVMQEQSVSVRVVLGVRRIITKKQHHRVSTNQVRYKIN